MSYFGPEAITPNFYQFKLEFADIDVCSMTEDIPSYVLEKLSKYRQKKENLKKDSYDGIISDSVMVLCKKEDSEKILQKCTPEFKIRTNLGHTMIFYI